MEFNLFEEEAFLQTPDEEQQQPQAQPENVEPESEPPSAQPTTNKRVQKNAKKEGRPRGRPRLHTRDETAAERRRTQIRLAQRAYRQRKESTITALKKKVNSHRQTIQSMHQSMLNFNDRALASSFQEWDPDLSARLSAMVDEVSDLVGDALRSTDVESDEEDASESPTLDPESLESQPTTDAEMATPAPLTFDSPFATTGFPNAPWDPQQGQQYPLLPHTQDQPSQSGQDPFDPASSEQFYRPFQYCAFFPPQDIPRECRKRLDFAFKPSPNLPLPSMQVWSETSFARRLRRQTIELGLRCLTNHGTSPDRLASLFRLSFVCNSRPALISHLNTLASRTASEGLEAVSSCELYLRDAGLRFARDRITSSESSPSETALIGPQRPFANFDSENTDYVGWEFRDIVKALEMGGEWLEACDVEELLKGKGLSISALSSIVEVADETNAKASATASLDGLAPTPMERFAQGALSSAIQMSQIEDFDEQDHIWMDAAAEDDDDKGLGAPFDDLTSAFNSTQRSLWLSTRADSLSTDASSVEVLVEHQSDELQPFNMHERVKKMFSVDLFVSYLLLHCVCLGHTAGFRRRIVEKAFEAAMSLQVVFDTGEIVMV